MPHYARRASIAYLLVLVSACASPASPTEISSAAPAAAPATGGSSEIAGTIVQLTNVERSLKGLNPLRANAKLMQAAQLQADQMARLGRLDHVLTDAQYPRPVDRLAAVGYEWGAYGENVAMGQANADAAMTAWMNSSGHRANILNGSMTEIGVGFARDGANRPYYVQVFGKPLK